MHSFLLCLFFFLLLHFVLSVALTPCSLSDAMLSVRMSFCVHGPMFRLVVSWPVSPLYVPPFLILGFVCSIWAKFSNGDNNRGGPRQWRRWVLPFDCVELHAFSRASQLHLPAFSFSPLFFSTYMHLLGFSIDSVLPSSAIVTVSLTNCHSPRATVARHFWNGVSKWDRVPVPSSLTRALLSRGSGRSKAVAVVFFLFLFKLYYTTWVGVEKLASCHPRLIYVQMYLLHRWILYIHELFPWSSSLLQTLGGELL